MIYLDAGTNAGAIALSGIESIDAVSTDPPFAFSCTNA